MTSARALSLLAHAASAVFLVAEVAGWVLGWWPATPLTFTVALVVVAIGPAVGMLHVATARAATPAEPAPAPVRALRRPEPPVALPPRLAAARRFHTWRNDGPAERRAAAGAHVTD